MNMLMMSVIMVSPFTTVVCEAGIVTSSLVTTLPLTWSRSNSRSLTNVASKIMVLTYTTFQDCDKDCNSSLDMHVGHLINDVTTYLYWYSMMISGGSRANEHENVPIKRIDARNVHPYPYIAQIRNTCSPTTFYGNQMLKRLYVIPTFITIIFAHHQNHHTTIN